MIYRSYFRKLVSRILARSWQSASWSLSLIMTVALNFYLLGSAGALDRDSFQHTPPQLAESGVVESIELTVPAKEIKRVRVLVEQNVGYSVLNLVQQGQVFKASVPFVDLAELNYSFQVETVAGSIFETKAYVIRKHSSDEYEKSIVDGTAELEKLQSRVVQLENTLQGLRVADPKMLAKQKNVELGRAVVLLSKRERQVQEAEQNQNTGSKKEL